MAEIAVPAPGGFTLVPGSVGVSRIADMTAAERAALLAAMDELEQTADLVLVDTGAGLSASVVSFVRAADLGLIVATPDPTSITDAYALIKCAASGADDARRPADPAPRLRLIVNEAADLAEARRVHARISAVCARFLGWEIPMAGWVAHDVRVVRAVRARTPVLVASPRCPASEHIRGIAAALASELAGVHGSVGQGGGWASVVAGWFRRSG